MPVPTGSLTDFTANLRKKASVEEINEAFKAAAAKRINLVRGEPGAPVWQRGYQEQRIDDPKTLERIRHLLLHQATETMPAEADFR